MFPYIEIISILTMADTKQYTREEVSKHKKAGDLWIIIDGKVYDVSNFDDHPGTMSVFYDNGGKDATESFVAQEHSGSAKRKMKDYLVGEIKEQPKEAAKEDEEETIDTSKSNLRKRNVKKIGEFITEEELQQHCVMGDTWMLIEGKVYDVSKFDHPGGKQILVDNSGRDATREFLDIGHKNAHKRMPDLYIGEFENQGNKDWTPLAQDTDEGGNNTLMYIILGIVGFLLAKYMLDF